jgi:hypothetical protein
VSDRYSLAKKIVASNLPSFFFFFFFLCKSSSESVVQRKFQIKERIMGENQKEANWMGESDEDTCPGGKWGLRFSHVCVAHGMFDEPPCWVSLE